MKRNNLTVDNVRLAKRYSMPDVIIAGFTNKTEDEVRQFRLDHGITPTFKMVDTCAAEFEAATPYYYSCYADEDEVKPLGKKSVIVLGSGPIRIGQGIEFDYCSVHSAWALRKAGMNSIIVNNNPETVSTDFDTSDSLYFEPLTVEDVMAVVDKENRSASSASSAARQLSTWQLPWQNGASPSSVRLSTAWTAPKTANASTKSWPN